MVGLDLLEEGVFAGGIWGVLGVVDAAARSRTHRLGGIRKRIERDIGYRTRLFNHRRIPISLRHRKHKHLPLTFRPLRWRRRLLHHRPIFTILRWFLRDAPISRTTLKLRLRHVDIQLLFEQIGLVLVDGLLLVAELFELEEFVTGVVEIGLWDAFVAVAGHCAGLLWALI